MVRTDFWHLSPESGYRQTQCDDLRAARNITLVLHATVTHLQAAPGKVFHHWMKDNKNPDRLGLLMLRAYKKLDSWADRRLAGVVRAAQLKLRRGGLFLIARAEQAPNPASRVSLSATQRDPLGLPRVELQWNMSAQDKHSIRAFTLAIGGELRRLGLGDVRLSEWVRDEGLELPYDRTVSNNPIGGYHHMGTTRMAADPRHGVVDGDCRVHGYRNLYISGSSTFATAGWANPTFTIVALALRLGEHLERKLGQKIGIY